ncbi:MAG: tetratricopeptide repeat protein [Gemmatimonadota bacterium]|nr:tetratricopeptide repeat protein [Gemmatimonadota bacterium]
MDAELAIYNKLGDLYVRVGKVPSGVATYEKAVDRYTENGFPNNAIALCNKILRNAPGRTPVYLKLAKLMVDRGFVAEAKRNLLEYAARMQKSGKLEDSFDALKEFADLSPDNEEIRLLLAEQLKAAARTEEAREQLAKLYAEVESTGDERRTRATLQKLRQIDPEYDVEAAAPQVTVKKKAKTGDLIFLDLDEPSPAAAPTVAYEKDAAPPVDEVPVDAAVEFVATSLEEETAEAKAELVEDAEEGPARAAEIEPTSMVEETEAALADGVDVERVSADYLTAAEGEVETLDGLDVNAEFESPPAAAVEALDFEPTAVEEPPREVPEALAEEVLEVVQEPSGDEAVVVEEPEIIGQAYAPEEPVAVPPGDLASMVDEEEPVPVWEVDEEADTGVDLSDIASDVEEAVADEGLVAEPPVIEVEEPVVEPPPAADEEILVEEEIPVVEAATPVEEDIAVDEDVPVVEPPLPADEFVVQVEEPESIELSTAGSGGDLGVDVQDGTSIWDETEVGDFEVPELDLEGFGIEEPPKKVAGAPEGVVAAMGVERLEGLVADDPDNPEIHRALAEALIEEGGRERGLEELDIALRLHEHDKQWGKADRVVGEILRLDPNSIRHHQKRVELAFQQGDKSALAGAYLGLADALFRTGAADRARVVYQRVLEHDPTSQQALAGLSTLEPAEAKPPDGRPSEAARFKVADEPPDEGDFIDLGALILEEEQSAPDTRMRIQDEEPTGDEQKDFEEMLDEFKRGIEANLPDEDWQAHYDLGVAFKEMGLLDEAIAEFQKSLRSSEGRLQTAEALGLCFFEKGQHSVAGTVLRRALDSEPGGDDSKIGLLYWLGRCEEEQGRPDEALTNYQRVFAVDINFEDVDKRVRAIAGD